jgi:hypothetical protein
MFVFETVHTRGVPGSHGRTPTFINIKPQARANKPRAKPNPVQNNSRSTADINIYHTEIIWWSHCNANGAAFATFIYVRFGSTKHLTAACCNYMTHVATVANPGSASQLNLSYASDIRAMYLGIFANFKNRERVRNQILLASRTAPGTRTIIVDTCSPVLGSESK